MILVCGTGRSGTSMWMQVLASAGLDVVGDAFPLDWRDRFYEANPRGFYESTLVNGINFTTNPDPNTGARLESENTREVAVKVLLPGVPLTQRVFIDRVILTVRDWRSYVASRYRADAMLRSFEGKSMPEGARKQPASPRQWWFEHYQALQDARRRGYELRVVRYEDAVAEPHVHVRSTLAWLGVDCDVEAGVAAVEPGLRTQEESPTPSGLTEEWIRALDGMQTMLARGRLPTGDEFLQLEAHAADVAEYTKTVDPWAERAAGLGTTRER